MLADIASGETAWADIFFLIAAILFGLSALLPLRESPRVIDGILVPAGLCLVSIAWLVL